MPARFILLFIPHFHIGKSCPILLMLDISDHKVWEATKLLYNAFRYDDQLQRLDPDNLKEFK